jgi:hypothetical protein
MNANAITAIPTKKADVSVPILGSNTSAYSLMSLPDKPDCSSFNLPKFHGRVYQVHPGKETTLAKCLDLPPLESSFRYGSSKVKLELKTMTLGGK